MKYRKTYVKYKTGGSHNDNSETGINRILEMDDIEYYDFINQYISRYFIYPNRPYLIRKIVIEAAKDPILYFYDDDSRGVIYVDGRIYRDFIEAFANINRPKFNKFVKKVMSNSGYPHIDLVYFKYRDRLYSYFHAYSNYIQGVIDKLGIK